MVMMIMDACVCNGFIGKKFADLSVPFSTVRSKHLHSRLSSWLLMAPKRLCRFPYGCVTFYVGKSSQETVSRHRRALKENIVIQFYHSSL